MSKEQDLLALCEKYILDNEISCPDTIYQTDWVIQNAYDFIEEICDIVGYYKYPEDGN